MSDLKPRGIPIILDGVERHFLFTLNIIDELQDKYEKNLYEIIEDLTKNEESGHLLRDVVTILLNDEAERAERRGIQDPPAWVTQQDVGEMIGLDNYWDVTAALLRAYGVSLPELEDEDPNQESGQTNS